MIFFCFFIHKFCDKVNAFKRERVKALKFLILIYASTLSRVYASTTYIPETFSLNV